MSRRGDKVKKRAIYVGIIFLLIVLILFFVSKFVIKDFGEFFGLDVLGKKLSAWKEKSVGGERALLAPLECSSQRCVYVDAQLTNDCLSGNYNIQTRMCDGSDGNAYNAIQKAADIAIAGDIVYVRGGEYNESVIFNTDGNLVDGNIIFRNYPGEKPLIWGAEKIGGIWGQCSIGECPGFPEPNNVYYINIPSLWLRGLEELNGNSGTFVMDQIFEDGERMVYAHWPDQYVHDSYRPELMYNITGGSSYTIEDNIHLTQSDGFWNGAVLKVGFGTNVGEAHFYDITDFGSSIITTNKVMRRNPPDIRYDKYTIMNHPFALDTPGEFFINYTSNRLYLMTLERDNPSNHNISISRRGNALNLQGVRSYITIDGFEIKGFYSDAISSLMYGSSLMQGLEIRNNIIHSNLGSGVRIGNYNSVRLNNSVIENNIVYHQDVKGLYITPRNTTFLRIVNNTIYENNDDGIQMGYDSSDLLIEGNTIMNHTSGRGHTDGIKLERGNFVNLTISRNKLINSHIDYGTLGWTSYTNLKLINNVFSGGGYFATLRNPVNGVDIIGNTCYYVSINSCVWITSSVTNAYVRNNILYTGQGYSTDLGNADADYNYFMPVMPINGNKGANSFSGPGDFFIDANNNDFHLKQGAVVIDRGESVALYSDIDGNSRPQGAGWDIGAYEYQSTGNYNENWTNGPLFNDSSFFPIAVWLQDPANAKKYKDIGINVYVGLWQGPTEAQLSRLKQEGMYAFVSQNSVGLNSQNNSMLWGWMQQDEPDNAQWNATRGAYDPCISPTRLIEIYNNIEGNDRTRPVLLNFGQGVSYINYPGRGTCTGNITYYFDAINAGDIISYDIYPVTSPYSAVRGKLEYVAQGVSNLVNWTNGSKIIWNWIETTHIQNETNRPTPKQIRSEVWMSLISGSKGIGYFVHEWQPSFREDGIFRYPEIVGNITELNKEILSLAPVLNSPDIKEVNVSSSSIKAMMKRYSGSVYIFSVNMRNESTIAGFNVSDVSSGVVNVLGENRSIALSGGNFADNFDGYGVHLYEIFGGVASCSDGVKNGYETGVDCGGSCPPCLIDNQPPIINLIKPNNNEEINSNSVTFTYTPSDYSSISNCTLFVGIETRVDFEIENGIENSFVVNLPNGDYVWNISCVDVKGNIGISESRNLSVNYQAPPVETPSSGGGGGGGGFPAIKPKPKAENVSNVSVAAEELEKIILGNNLSFIDISANEEEKILVDIYGNSYAVSFVLSEDGRVLAKLFNGDYIIPREDILPIALGNSEMYVGIVTSDIERAKVVLGLDASVVKEKVGKVEGGVGGEEGRKFKGLYYALIGIVAVLVFVIIVLVIWYARKSTGERNFEGKKAFAQK